MGNFWKHRAVFVSGATGLVGGWLVKRLLNEDARVVALVRDSAPHSMLVRDEDITRVEIVHGDILDHTLLRRVFCEYEIDTVFHLAAQTIVGVAKQDPIGTLESNVRGTWTVLEASRQAQVRQVVVASSDKAYGPAEVLPYLETTPLQGRFPYDASKSCADLICTMYARSYQLPVVVARCANIFGGGDLNFSRVIPGVIQATLQGERFVIRSDGKFVRDLLYVEDAASAYVTLAQSLASNRALAGESFNFSLEVRLTVLEVVQCVLKLMGRSDLAPIIQNSVSSEIREQWLACDKARRMLNWAPAYSVEEGLTRTIAWYTAFLGYRAQAAVVV